VVKWFNNDKGYGFIKRDTGEDVFVHHTAIQASGYRTLNEGERVEFDVKQGRLPHTLILRTFRRASRTLRASRQSQEAQEPAPALSPSGQSRTEHQRTEKGHEERNRWGPLDEPCGNGRAR